MDAQALREHLEGTGFRLSVVPDGLRVEPASALTTETRQLIRANRDALVGLVRRSPPTVAESSERSWCFRVTYPNGLAFEARTLPEATQAEARELWPGATVEPIPERPASRRAANREAGRIFVALKRLWARTGESNHAEFPEALETALANPDTALASLHADGCLP